MFASSLNVMMTTESCMVRWSCCEAEIVSYDGIAEVRRQNAEVRSQNAEVRSQNAEVKSLDFRIPANFYLLTSDF
jgi:hypothetical protein